MNRVMQLIVGAFLALMVSVPTYGMGGNGKRSERFSAKQSARELRQRNRFDRDSVTLSSNNRSVTKVEESLTQREQEALDEDIAFALMQSEFESTGIDPVARLRAVEADAAYAEQLQLEEIGEIDTQILMFDEPVRSGLDNRPVPAVGRSSVSPDSSLDSYWLDVNRVREDRIVQSVIRSLSQVSNLPSLMICADGDMAALAETVGQRLAFPVKRRDFTTYGGSVDSACIQARYLVDELKNASEVQNGPHQMYVLDMRAIPTVSQGNALVDTKWRKVRDILSGLSWKSNKHSMLVIIVSPLEPLYNELYLIASQGRNFLSIVDGHIHAREQVSGSRAQNVVRAAAVPLQRRFDRVNRSHSPAENVVGRNDRVASSNFASTSSRPVSNRSNSPAESNAASQECPICFENQTNMNAPCCLTKVCHNCWESSLRATANAGAGVGAMPRQCPFCKAEESTWLD